MRTAWNWLMTFAVAGATALLLVGCSSRPATSGRTGDNKTSTTSADALPTPFAVTDRFSAKSLGLDDPVGLAIGPNGDLYVTDISQRVSEISAGGEVVRRWGGSGNRPGKFRFVSSDPSDPLDIGASIAIGPDGMVYVADANARVQVFTAQGRFVRQFGSFGSGAGQFLSAPDVVVDSGGSVYTADDHPHFLAKFAPSGQLIWELGANTPSDSDLAGPLHLATIDVHNRLVVSNDDTSTIAYVDQDGREVDSFVVAPDASNPDPNPACGTTVDALGYVYVTACGPSGACACTATQVFDRTHHLVAHWPGTKNPLREPPVFGPSGEVFALGQDGSVLRLRITLAGW